MSKQNWGDGVTPYPNSIFLKKDLHPYELNILLLIYSYNSHGENKLFSIALMSKRLGIAKNTLRKYLRSLIDKGYVFKTKEACISESVPSEYGVNLGKIF